MPKDIKLAGEKTVFTATVTYDTRELYGKVTGSYEIVLASRTR